jgi:HEAT repeat protein
VLVELAQFAKTNQNAFLTVVDRIPQPSIYGNPDDRLIERQVRGELIGYLTHCVPELISILEAWADQCSRSERDYDDMLRAERVVQILRDIGKPAAAAVPALIRAMHADQRGTGELAGVALGKIGGEEAIRELNRVWFSGWDRKLCESCDSALTELGERAHDVLLRIVGEANPVERASAVLSLKNAGYPEKHLGILALKLLSDSSIPIIETAIEFLGRFEDPTQAEPALPKLREICSDEEQYFDSTRAKAARVIAEITERIAR